MSRAETREKVYQFVRSRLLQGSPPTIREVQRAVGLKAVESARAHLEALVEDGLLVKEPGRSRGYSLPGGDLPPVAYVPLLGRVHAGDFHLALEDLEGYLPVGSAAADMFALRVQGESMLGAGILPGDVVIVRRQPTARSGEIVVALVEDEATVKRLKLKEDRVELHPENENFEVLIPPPGEVRILGKVLEVRRYLEGP
ncbi:MAG: repressor LexA [Armatimonadetes bacterium]|nr:repressor LexA [Armatimonadota bacterium]